MKIHGSIETLNATLDLDLDAYRSLTNPESFSLPAELRQVIIKTEDKVFAKTEIDIKGKRWSKIEIETNI